MNLRTFTPMFKCMSDTFGEETSFLSKMFEPSNSSLTICEQVEKKVPLAILVFACATIPHYKEEIKTIEETWGHDAKKAGIPIFFILGEEQTDLQGSQYIYLKDVDNTYESAKVKQFLGHFLICKNINPDMLFLCGSDTFVNIPKLMKLSCLINPEIPALLGNDGFRKQFGPILGDFLSGGGGLLTTRAANRLIIPYCDSICQKWSIACGVFRSDLTAASDVMLSFLAFYLKIQFIQVTGIYHCSWKSIDSITGPISIDSIITCHGMSRQDSLDFYTILQGNNYFLNKC